MGRPINNKFFGNKGNALAVKFYDGSSVVTGYIVKQTGSKKFKVSNTAGNVVKICRLAQTTQEMALLTSGTVLAGVNRADLCTIEVTPFGGGIENVKALHSNKIVTVQGTKVIHKPGIAAAGSGKGTIAVKTGSGTIGNQVGTVAGAFSFVLPASGFTDLRSNYTITSVTTTAAAALSTIGFAYTAATKTLSKAAGASSVGAKTIIVNATDGVATIQITFTVTLS
jgi:hypothetical protein